MAEALKFLARSLQFAQQGNGQEGKFIPVCIGEPGTLPEIVASIKQYGGWVAKDIPKRDDMLAKIAKAREVIGQAAKGKKFV